MKQDTTENIDTQLHHHVSSGSAIDDMNVPPPPYEEATFQSTADQGYTQFHTTTSFKTFYVPILDQSPFWAIECDFPPIPSNSLVSPAIWYTFLHEVTNKAQITAGFKVTKDSMRFGALEFLSSHSIRQSIWSMKCIDIQDLINRWNIGYFSEHGVQITLLQGEPNMLGYLSSPIYGRKIDRYSYCRYCLKVEAL
ncbi:hypothetical protein BGW37DRAFT_549049 [Umbelopsis sp. PMI_123]|nr:hypothetical protein BGW37DRAFT_549049 [Umbelopsis sp. PMI_123]